MDQWRQAALDRLPTLEDLINQSDDPTDFWIQLWIEFKAAYYRDPIDEGVIQGAYAWATWCLVSSKSQRVQDSTIISFFEELPSDSRVKADIPNRMTKEDFMGMKDVFRCSLRSEAEYRAFMDEMMNRTFKEKPNQAVHATSGSAAEPSSHDG